MKFKLKTFPDFGLLVIRLVLGLSYVIAHGGVKLFAGPATWTKVGSAVSLFGINFMFTAWGLLAACSEFFGGILILLGLFFRPASVFIIITMLVAANQGLNTGKSLSSIVYPLELGITILGLFFTGPGKYSLDFYLFGKKRI
ncbi:MAG TPA: DoxX family protein [Ignavibacteriaceae bacterium]